MPMRAALTISLLIILLAGTACGDTWTNAAGHAIEADLIRLDGTLAAFKQADGSLLELPLTSLSAGSRAKAEAEWRAYQVPLVVRGPYDHCVRTLRRLRELRESDGLDANEYAIRRQVAFSTLQVVCARLRADEKLTPEDVDKVLFLAGTN